MLSAHKYFIAKFKHYHLSFKNALQGISIALSTQQNFKVHLFISAIILIFGFLLKISRIEMLLIVICIAFGLGAEMINTAIEAMTDLITSEWKKEAKIAKDISAGMVLVVATGTLIIGLYIFFPRLYQIFVNNL
ncbi:hypothetical protein A2W14_00255 [Candidatus Gottesmanbacteria bacterium RBG_16_37_8]|uniref:Diacylglycerol kinase n=1 Tax=Candidatus Gottesmanbacteria bacterium RBG_16_37_8 TaxID=1798371 RepID=A0A1F5YRW1_9BACT|nr:MAG: hypothetical protein A2W14_00255 [Candidatus Gottesmanbacteria bacterium RBG_16_37_8]